MKTKRGHWKFQCKLKISTLHHRYDVLVCGTFPGLVLSRGRAPASQPAIQPKQPPPASQPDFLKPARLPETGRPAKLAADWHHNSERDGGS